MPAAAGVIVDERVEHYHVDGQNAVELAGQMQSLGPLDPKIGRRSAAYTHWNVSWSQLSQMQEGRCRLVDLVVRVEIVLTLPQWEGSEGNGPMAREWRRFMASLQEHEAVHQQHGREAAAAVHDVLLEVEPQPGCRGLERAINQAAREELKRYAAMSRQYDARTNFGASQGTQLRPAKRSRP